MQYFRRKKLVAPNLRFSIYKEAYLCYTDCKVFWNTKVRKFGLKGDKMIKAVFCDLDGTLLGRDMMLSRENSAAISELEAAGVRFIPTSGRNFFEMPESIRRHEAINRYLCSNGSGYYNLKTGESRHKSLPADKAASIIDMLGGMTVVPIVHSVDGRGYFDRANLDYGLMRDRRMSEYYCKYFFENAYAVDNMYRHFTEGIGINSICAFFKYDEEIDEAKSVLEQLGVGYTNSTFGELEIFNPAAGKGNGLREFAASHGLSLEETMAIGDSMNDKSMLEITPNSVAVSNANEKILEIARYVGCSNEEHIVRYVVDHIL